MSKYNLEFKLSVIHHYQLGMNGQEATAKLFNTNKSNLQKWVLAYERHGLEGLTHWSGSYTPEFKELVIQHRHQQHLSYLETAVSFKIPSPNTIRVWERLYHEVGRQALIDQRCRKTYMSKSPKPSLGKPLEEMSKEELLAELQHLRMENAYLKKLRALIQEEKESASRQKRDSSMN